MRAPPAPRVDADAPPFFFFGARSLSREARVAALHAPPPATTATRPAPHARALGVILNPSSPLLAAARASFMGGASRGTAPPPPSRARSRRKTNDVGESEKKKKRDGSKPRSAGAARGQRRARGAAHGAPPAPLSPPPHQATSRVRPCHPHAPWLLAWGDAASAQYGARAREPPPVPAAFASRRRPRTRTRRSEPPIKTKARSNSRQKARGCNAEVKKHPAATPRSKGT